MTVTQQVQDALLAREPIAHRREIIHDQASFDAEIAPEFWEWGASGQRYERGAVRSIVLARLAGREADPLRVGYTIEDEAVREWAPGLFQVTYTLVGQGRVTRRSTVYRAAGAGYQALFHQGTVVEAAEEGAN